MLAVYANAVPAKARRTDKSTKDARTLSKPILRWIKRCMGNTHFLKRIADYVLHRPPKNSLKLFVKPEAFVHRKRLPNGTAIVITYIRPLGNYAETVRYFRTISTY